MQARLEQERLEFERRGLLPGGRPRPASTDTKQPRPVSGKAKDAKPSKETAAPPPAEPTPPVGESMDDTVFEVGDLAVFARWVIMRGACTRDVEVFLRRLKVQSSDHDVVKGRQGIPDDRIGYGRLLHTATESKS